MLMKTGSPNHPGLHSVSNTTTNKECSAYWMWWVYVHNPTIWEVEEGGSQVKQVKFEDHLDYFERKQYRTRCQSEHLP